jgi:hypothetical protein
MSTTEIFITLLHPGLSIPTLSSLPLTPWISLSHTGGRDRALLLLIPFLVLATIFDVCIIIIWRMTAALIVGVTAVYGEDGYGEHKSAEVE